MIEQIKNSVKSFLEEDIELGEYIVINPCNKGEIIGSL